MNTQLILNRIATIVIVVTAVGLWETKSFAQENKAFLKDGKIVVTTKNGTKTIDYSKDDKYSFSSQSPWQIKEEINPVREALDVYRKKGFSPYKKSVWIYNSKDDSQKILVEYITDDKNSRVIFSPDNDFVYYLGLSPRGTRDLYGVNLLTNEQFIITQVSQFNIVTCDDKVKHFIVVNKNEGQGPYYIYRLNGEEAEISDYNGSISGLNDAICP